MCDLTNWTDTEIKILDKLIDRSYSEISAALRRAGFDRSRSAVEKRIKRQARRQQPPIYLPSDLEDDEGEVFIADDPILEPEDYLPPSPPQILTSTQKALNTTAQRRGTVELYEDLLALRDGIPRYGSISSVKQQSNRLTACILLSDFHVGRIIHDDTRKVIYNPSIFKERVYRLFEKVIHQLENLPVDEIVILLAGDMVDGEGIYNGQAMQLEIDAAEQVKMISRELWGAIKTLRDRYPVVRIITCRGNHGRTGHSDEANWDNMVYMNLEFMVDMQQDPQLTIKNMYGNYNLFEVRTFKGLIRHWAPVQADTPSSRDKFAGWHNIHHWDILGYGHFHHCGYFSYNGLPIFRNGSLCGGDDYAEQFGSCDIPSQMMFLVSTTEAPVQIIPITL
jgi:hypothetical protein